MGSSSLPPPNPQASPVPSTKQIGIFLLLLGWLIISPIITGLAISFLPANWIPVLVKLIGILLLSGLLWPPVVGYAGWVQRRQWKASRPLALSLLLVAGYITFAAGIQALTEPGPLSGDLSWRAETVQRLFFLTPVALGLSFVGLRQVGIKQSWPDLLRAAGLALPHPPGLLTALALIALLTLGWPLTGALGDSWASGLISLQALAISLPETIFFWGGVLGLLLLKFPERRILAGSMILLLFVAFTPSMIVPRNDWSKLVLLVSSLPFALLMIELRLLSGTIWPGLLLAWAYRAAPLLFTDPRVEMPVITQPWQTLSHGWMVWGAGAAALLLILLHHLLATRRRLPRPALTGLVAGVALLAWGAWLGVWLAAGHPGFHNDGFLIIMREQADLSGAEAIEDLTARRAFVRDRLIETAERSQAPVRAALAAAGLTYRPFYLINMIRVEGHHRRMSEFADLPGVERVMLNPNVRPYSFQLSFGYGPTAEAGRGVEWNIHQTRADQVWEKGITGAGIIVGGQDTGYDWNHPALRRAYRGFHHGQVEHTYNWLDAWADSAVPFDDDQHGTHTMGTILGDDGQGNQIGMAPGAHWIGCRNMRRGLGNPASYTACMEFFLAPYPPGGDPFSDGDVSQAPHLVNNSWGCPNIEGCDDMVLAPALAALRAAGIMMVVSAGNDGPRCETVSEPPARYDEVFSVGATDNQGEITGFSSRGPVPTSEEPLLKPDISAPGANIRSSLPGGSYGVADGTSMAGPHVAGLVALLWSANPALIGQIDATEALIRDSARPVRVANACALPPPPGSVFLPEPVIAELNPLPPCACGGVSGTPNNVYGWGEIDALRAVEVALEQR